MPRRAVSVVVAGALLSLSGGAAPLAQATSEPAPTTPDRWAAAVNATREDPYYPAKGDPRIDALHYGLDLDWRPRTRTLRGTARIDLRVTSDTRRLVLDLGRPLRVRVVTMDHAPVRTEHRGNHLVVHAGTTLAKDSRHRLRVRYAGTPHQVDGPATRSDVARVGWTTEPDGQTWTMQEPYGALTWYPVHDQPSDKAFYDVRVSVPKRWTGVFNGELLSRGATGGRTVTRWRLHSPAAAYLTTLAIGDYVPRTSTGPHGLPVQSWLPSGAGVRMRRAADQVAPLLGWLERHQGPYPFDRVGLVTTPGGTAMETQTLVTISRRLLRSGADGRAVLLHELGHQWYGDTVTPDSWKDLWLNESWTMYTQIRWEVDQGLSTMAGWRRWLVRHDGDYRKEDGPPGRYDRGEFGDGSVYYCGALMLDQLRALVGDAAFADLWSTWPRARHDATSNRADWIAWASRRSGVDLEAFTTTWLTSPTTPELVRARRSGARPGPGA